MLPFTKEMPALKHRGEEVEQGITWEDDMSCINIHLKSQALTPSYCANVIHIGTVIISKGSIFLSGSKLWLIDFSSCKTRVVSPVWSFTAMRLVNHKLDSQRGSNSLKHSCVGQLDALRSLHLGACTWEAGEGDQSRDHGTVAAGAEAVLLPSDICSVRTGLATCLGLGHT